MTAKIKFTPPDYILVFIALEILAHYFFPIKQIISSSYNYFGIALIVLGQIPNFWIYFQFKNLKTTVKPYVLPKRLVTSGLFSIGRNPVYFGMALTLLGIAILLGSAITFVFPVLFVILTDIFMIPTEEKNLGKVFGKEYADYKRKVGRWIR